MLDTTVSLEEQCEQIWALTCQQKKDEDRARREPPNIRLWDAEWALQQVISGIEYEASFTWVSNDTGPGQIEIPFDHPAAQWIHDSQGRIDRGEGRGVHITVDYTSTRWSGRLDKAVVESREDGSTVMVLSFAHDYENLKFITCWSNPSLSQVLQLPRAFLLAGPVTWILLTTLQLNLHRMHNWLVSVPDDPLDLASYVDALDQSEWPIVVKPITFADAMRSGVSWGVVSSRWATWHDMAKVMLEDSELSVTCTRWLEGDPLPWDDANLRHGTLVVGIEDKSGIHIGTSNGGTVWDGLRRTVAEFTDDFLDSTNNLLSDSEYPADYYLPNNRMTHPEYPFVVYRTGEGSGVQTSKYINSPAKAVTVAVGGHSMPGINEAISATIQGIADIWGSIILIGSLGGSIDAMVKPLYEDTILAWMSVKNQQRADHAGWSRYEEFFQDVGGSTSKAYTITSLMVLRAGLWATKTVVANEMTVADAMPYQVGLAGHYFLDDRIGFSLENDPTGQVWVDRARKIELKWDSETFPEWVPTIGDPRNLQDPGQRAWGRIEQMIAALRDLGVWSIAALLGSASLLGVLQGISDGPAGSAHPLASRSNVSVISGERAPAETVTFGDVSVSSMTDLVNSVFTVSAPSEVDRTIVSLGPVDV